jgi:L-glyceraldehyde 3-phosphate reductase
VIYNTCPSAGLKVSVLSLGAWQTFGTYCDEETSKQCLLAAFDSGITHFDLADIYGASPGVAETLCGRILSEFPRNEMIVATKAGYRSWPGPYGIGCSRKHLVASCDASLRRLGMDYVDIFYAHCYDYDTPLDETLGTLNDLVKQGKVLYVGVSGYSLEQLHAAHDMSVARSYERISVVQRRLNILRTEVLEEFAKSSVDIGLIAYAPLSSGLLTGKYRPNMPEGSRAKFVRGKSWPEDSITPELDRCLTELQALASTVDMTLPQLCLLWVLRSGLVTSLVFGASTADQVRENVAVLRFGSGSGAFTRDLDLLVERVRNCTAGKQLK